MKFDHKLDQSEEILAVQQKVRNYIGLAQYKKAFQYLSKISKKYPKSYYIPSMLATLNAEDAYFLPNNEMNKAFKSAAKKLKRLLPAAKGATPRLRNRNINEYYWFSQQHLKQYQFGKKQVESGTLAGFYSQGVGAANHAYKLLLQGKKKQGMKWAKISQASWEEYFEKVAKDYHDPWYWYALALGLQGEMKKFEKAAEKSSELSCKNLKTAAPFKKLRKMVKEAFL